MPKTIPDYISIANALRRELTGFFSALGLEKKRIERIAKKYGYILHDPAEDENEHCHYVLLKKLKTSKSIIRIFLVYDSTGKIERVLLKSIEERDL